MKSCPKCGKRPPELEAGGDGADGEPPIMQIWGQDATTEGKRYGVHGDGGNGAKNDSRLV